MSDSIQYQELVNYLLAQESYGFGFSISLSATSSSLDNQYQKYNYPPPKNVLCVF